MTEIATFRFRDQAENDDACAIVRVEGGVIMLALTLEHSGDLEVAMTPADCKTLHRHFGEAILSLHPKVK